MHGYGIEMIFKRIFDILTKKNQFYFENKILKDIKECKEKINIYLNDSIEIKKKLAKTNELFKKYEGEENILEEAHKNAEKEKTK